jgi:hypothetical protein
MLSWLNPFKWWQLYRHRQRWQHINLQLTDAYHQQDYRLTAASAEFLVEIALQSGNKQLLLKSYQGLFFCYEEIKHFEVAIDCRRQVMKLRKQLKQELARYPLDERWWI